jgi:hypothetical protein
MRTSGLSSTRRTAALFHKNMRSHSRKRVCPTHSSMSSRPVTSISTPGLLHQSTQVKHYAMPRCKKPATDTRPLTAGCQHAANHSQLVVSGFVSVPLNVPRSIMIIAVWRTANSDEDIVSSLLVSAIQFLISLRSWAERPANSAAVTQRIGAKTRP